MRAIFVSIEELRSARLPAELRRVRVLALAVNAIGPRLAAADFAPSGRWLRELRLRDNRLSGDGGLGAALAGAPLLELLDVDMNRLSTLAGLARAGGDGGARVGCARLRALSAAGNLIDSTAGLDACAALESVVLYRNKLTRLGPELGALRRLRLLDVGRNALRSFDGALSRCASLRVLVAYENELADAQLADELAAGALCSELWLSGNRLRSLGGALGGALGGGWCALHVLTVDVSDNALSQLDALCVCLNLRTLNAAFNRVDALGALAPLSACAKLRAMQLNDNPIASSRHYTHLLVLLLPALAELDGEPLPATAHDEAARALLLPLSLIHI